MPYSFLEKTPGQTLPRASDISTENSREAFSFNHVRDAAY